MDEPRFYVRHTVASREANSEDYTAIRDRYYCCRDVAVFTPAMCPYKRLKANDWRPLSTREVRAYAESICAQWNAEHDALLAAEGMASR